MHALIARIGLAATALGATEAGVAGQLASSATTHPLHAVTSAGQDLYEYEALLRQTFGSTISQCTGNSGCDAGWYYRGDRSPLAEYSPVMFVFNDFGRSMFHLMPTWFRVAPGAFGNYPTAVLVNGRYVACNAKATTFLINFGDGVGAGNWSCLAPLSS